MTDIEHILSECVEEVSSRITKSEYLKELLIKGKKFEGWFQIQLACKLYEILKDSGTTGVLIEKGVSKNRYADVFIKRKEEKGIAIEVKFLVMGKSITNSRESFIKQLETSVHVGESYGVAIMVSKNGTAWFEEEHKNIIENYPIISKQGKSRLEYICSAYSKDLISVRIFKVINY